MGSGRLPTPTPTWVCESDTAAWRRGPTWKGHALLLRARRSEFRFPLTEAPGRPPFGSKRIVLEDKRIEATTGRDSRRRARAGHRTGRRDRCGQGVGQGVCAPTATRWAGRAAEPGVGRGGDHSGVTELAEHLIGERIEKVTVESTSDYWRTWFYLLEAAGLAVQLVNARDVKNVPGRAKSDKLDAVWLAKLTEKGMLRASFVPPAPIRELRDYTRLRIDLTHDRSRHVQRLEKLLEDALIKFSAVASDIMGVSGRAMIEALIAGERDPRRLADLARGKMKAKRAALIEALTGRFDVTTPNSRGCCSTRSTPSPARSTPSPPGSRP